MTYMAALKSRPNPTLSDLSNARQSETGAFFPEQESQARMV